MPSTHISTKLAHDTPPPHTCQRHIITVTSFLPRDGTVRFCGYVLYEEPVRLDVQESYE